MKLQYFTEVCQKILTAVVAGIEMIFVSDILSLKLPMEFLSSLIKSEFILTAAVEIDGQPRRPYLCPVPLRKNKRTILVPVRTSIGFPNTRPEQPTLGLAGGGSAMSAALCALTDENSSG